MYKTRSLILIFFSACFFPLCVKGQDSTDTKNKKVFYFIDADCEHCSIINYEDSRIWITTNGTYACDWDKRESALNKFRDIIAHKYKADSALITHAVFRFQDSEADIKASYDAKEIKMKDRGYVLIKIEF